ncbi:MAG: hypothetical protein AAFR75_05740 [Pseudomonadota bacterium]
MLKTICSVLLAIGLLGCTGKDPGVLYQVLVLKDGQKVASPSLVGEFEQAVSFKLSDEVRVELVSMPPVGDKSIVVAEIFFPQLGTQKAEHRFEAEMDLSLTPSFQYTSKDRQYRVEIMPRRIDLPENRAEI